MFGELCGNKKAPWKVPTGNLQYGGTKHKKRKVTLRAWLFARGVKMSINKPWLFTIEPCKTSITCLPV